MYNAEFMGKVEMIQTPSLSQKCRPVSVLVREIRHIADGVLELFHGAAVHEPRGDVAKVVSVEPRHSGAPDIEQSAMRGVQGMSDNMTLW